MRSLVRRWVNATFFVAWMLPAVTSPADEIKLGGRTFTIPAGCELKMAATAPLTRRPICADFDERGRLYVAESSGSNEAVETQLATKPHQILRLEDADGDGVFDKRTVFADGMMLPEGTLWHQGALYVTAPPSIWRLVDDDDDGRADRREVWFDGQTLTGCANDLHGPFLGPDGWIYWCKGAFAEQSHQLTNGRQLTSRAAHIFRRRPSGGPVEVVMTGGMDNPVELIFTQQGERIFSTTFLQHPAGGRRDGLIHALYGGVYGKQHGVLAGHPRTGGLLPALTHLGAAAPSGLARLRGDALGWQHQLLTACFNLHKVTRHQLQPAGASFTTTDHDLVSSRDLDFHPTDVIEDADGSVLIVDTGGWYKLCCPTSQLEKPDVFGHIYRLSKRHAPQPMDPRGHGISWRDTTMESLARYLSDPRPEVRKQAATALVARGQDAIPVLENVMQQSTTPEPSIRAVWALCRIPLGDARLAVRSALDHRDEAVQRAAAHAVSVWRDQLAEPQLIELLQQSPSTQRVAAEALGRLDNPSAIPSLVDALLSPELDRGLEHSLIYALIELNDVAGTRPFLEDTRPDVQRAAILALDQMAAAALTADDVVPHLCSSHERLRSVAIDVVARHPDWGPAVRKQLESHPDLLSVDTPETKALLEGLRDLSAVQALIAARLQQESRTGTQGILLNVLQEAKAKPNVWMDQVATLLESPDRSVVAAAIQLLASHPREVAQSGLTTQIRRIILDSQYPLAVRLRGASTFDELDDELFQFILAQLPLDRPSQVRSIAARQISQHRLTPKQLAMLADQLSRLGPMELPAVLPAFAGQKDPQLGVSIMAALARNASIETISKRQLETLAEPFGENALREARILARASPTRETEARQLDDILRQLPLGDERRGQQVFHDDKLACFGCHAMGYRGGVAGPDLTRIARIRSRRDLLEAILFPSRSFVRSYEPLVVVTATGKTMMGTLKDQDDTSLVLQVSATETLTIPRNEIVQQTPGRVSIMPAGIEALMSRQQLADLLTFLESRK